MRIGDKVFPETSGTWDGANVGARVSAGRILAQKIGGGIARPNGRRALVGAMLIHLSEALDLGREAFQKEANDDGDFARPLLHIQDAIRDAMVGCQATLLGMGEREERAAPIGDERGPDTENPNGSVAHQPLRQGREGGR